MIELKNCPFCGGKAKLYVSDMYGVCVKCINCGNRTSYYNDNNINECGSVEKSISRWNQRIESQNG